MLLGTKVYSLSFIIFRCWLVLIWEKCVLSKMQFKNQPGSFVVLVFS